MQSILDAINEWIKDILIGSIQGNLEALFGDVNEKVGTIAAEVGKTPQSWNGSVFSMIKTLSENVIVPIAGLVITYVLCYELISMIIDKNNLHELDTFMFFKWFFKAWVAVFIVTHTFDITMAVFDVAQHVVTQAGGIIAGSTAIDDSTLATVQSTLEAMDIGPLLSIYLQTIIVRFLIYILSALIFVIVYARMIEIYLMVSLAPIPFSTFGNREQSMIGQNYLRSLFALGFQGFLIMVCVGIYAVLIQSVAFSTDIIGSLWGVLGYTILLAFTLFKTGAVAKSILHAH